MHSALDLYEQYLLAAVALGGTFLAAWVLARLPHSRLAPLVLSYRGLTPPFLSVIGVLFALNLAFLANDTWSAHDKALSSVFQEAGSLRGLALLARNLPPAERGRVDERIASYIRLTVTEEWPLLAHRRSSPAVDTELEALLTLLSRPEVAGALNANVHALMLSQAVQVRNMRELRIVLSQTHINPLKWMGVAFLGFLTLVGVAMAYIDAPARGLLFAVMLFASCAAPTAAIVLVQGNPYQAPGAITAEPIERLLDAR